MADYILYNGTYDPKYYFSDPATFLGASALWWSKLYARNDTWDYATSGDFYENVLGTSVGFYANYQQARSAMGPSAPAAAVAAVAAFITSITDKDYIDLTDARSATAAQLGKLIDEKLLSSRGETAYNSVKEYLEIKNSDYRYLMYESKTGPSGITHSHSGIKEQFDAALTAEQINYVNNTLGPYSYFIPSYVDAFNARMNEIKTVNSGSTSISVPVITDSSIAEEMANILANNSYELDF